jgi:hypothetical protein
VGEEGEFRDANSWSEGGPQVQGPGAAPQELAPGTSDTEATTPR